MGAPTNDYELIRLVEAYPILYDKNLARGQKNAALKDKAWRDLSLRLNISERACITRWKSIRDRFGKEFRRVQENPNECVNWDMFEHLLFLRDHYKHGHANDALLTVKIEPKKRKRGRRPRVGGGDTSQVEEEEEDDADEEMCADNLIINQQLIALVKEHPVLYDKFKIRDSKNLTAKNEAWKDISESLGISEENCYKRWKKLRDRFPREYRAQKLDPERPLTWIYFQDMMFLESHYRKGVPLPIEDIKRKINETSEEYWGDEYPFECLKDEETESEQMQEFAETRTQSLDELLIIPSKAAPENSNLTSSLPQSQLSASATWTQEAPAEAQLTNVISSIEQVLQQSQHCLKSLQQQRQQHKAELESRLYSGPVDMLQKVHILLDGLSTEHRQLAERRIVQFLCECQIKTLNNEEIDDVCSIADY